MFFADRAHLAVFCEDRRHNLSYAFGPCDRNQPRVQRRSQPLVLVGVVHKNGKFRLITSVNLAEAPDRNYFRLSVSFLRSAAIAISRS